MPGTVLICIRIVCFVKNFDNKASFECRMRSCYFGGSAFCIRVLYCNCWMMIRFFFRIVHLNICGRCCEYWIFISINFQISIFVNVTAIKIKRATDIKPESRPLL